MVPVGPLDWREAERHRKPEGSIRSRAMARTYKRDSRGRFASGGGSGGGRPKAKKVSREKNLLTRDNAGRITSVGGDGATGRGGRLRTASGKKRATQLERLKVRSSNMIGGRTARTVKGQKVMAKMAGAPKAKSGRAGGTQAITATAKGSGVGSAPKLVKARTTTGRGGRMKPPVTTSGLLREGGNRWQKNGMDRIYFNNLAGRAGMKTVKYKSGNIYSAEVRGRGISNSKASEILGNLSNTKVFYDRQKRKMTVQEPGVRIGRYEQRDAAARMAKQAAASITRKSRAKVKNWKRRRS